MENETDTKARRTDERDTLSTTLNSTSKKRTLVEEGPRKTLEDTQSEERSPTV